KRAAARTARLICFARTTRRAVSVENRPERCSTRTSMTAQIHLHGKVAIVTGASRGIGEAIARAFAAAGAKVVLASRKIEGVSAVADAIVKEHGAGSALAVAVHTGKEDDCKALVAKAVEAFGKVDVLVNNAATNPYFGPMLDIDGGAWDKTFEVNLKGY